MPIILLFFVWYYCFNHWSYPDHILTVNMFYLNCMSKSKTNLINLIIILANLHINKSKCVKVKPCFNFFTFLYIVYYTYKTESTLLPLTVFQCNSVTSRDVYVWAVSKYFLYCDSIHMLFFVNACDKKYYVWVDASIPTGVAQRGKRLRREPKQHLRLICTFHLQPHSL